MRTKRSGEARRFSVMTAERIPITLDSMYCIPRHLSPWLFPAGGAMSRRLGTCRPSQCWMARRRSWVGLVTGSISAIRPPERVKLSTEMGSSLVPNSSPAAPLTTASRANATNRGAVCITCPGTAAAPVRVRSGSRPGPRSKRSTAVPFLSLRLAFTDAGTNPASYTSRQAYDLLAKGFSPETNGPLVVAVALPRPADGAPLAVLRADLAGQPDVEYVGPAQYNPGRTAAALTVIPRTSPRTPAPRRWSGSSGTRWCRGPPPRPPS